MILVNGATPPTYATAASPQPAVWLDRRGLSHCVLLTGVVFLSYYGMWRAYFATLDDFGITGWVLHQASFWDALQGYGSGVRFFNYIPLRLKTELFAMEATPYLWSSLLQYLLLTWLVYGLARRLMQQPRHAFLAALLFATGYSHYEVVTYVSASDYTLWASVYLSVLLLFAGYLREAKSGLYWGAVVLYLMLAFAHDFTLSLPLVLAAYHLTVGWKDRIRLVLRWRDLRLHLPFWAIWAIHFGLQLQFVLAGTSEAVYSDNRYAPGLHMLSNLRYLIFLIIPNMTIDPIQNFLTLHLPGAIVMGMWTMAMIVGILLHGLLLWLFWRGGAVVRFAVALIYLPYLQYTPWHGHFIEAPRYLLLPSIGSSLLLAQLALAITKVAGQRRSCGVALASSTLLVLYLVGNVGVIQVWVKQHIENGYLRHAFVTDLATHYQQIDHDDQIWIEVPKEKFLDLAAACRFVFSTYVPCQTFVTGEPTPTVTKAEQGAGTLYWLRATENGIVQVKPPLNGSN